MIKGEAANRCQSKSTGPFKRGARPRSAPATRANRTRPDARIPFGNREIVIGQSEIASCVYTRTRSNTREGEPACQSTVMGLPLRRGGREAASTPPPRPRPARLPLPCVPGRDTPPAGLCGYQGSGKTVPTDQFLMEPEAGDGLSFRVITARRTAGALAIVVQGISPALPAIDLACCSYSGLTAALRGLEPVV
jgi:hypothetical protein